MLEEEKKEKRERSERERERKRIVGTERIFFGVSLERQNPAKVFLEREKRFGKNVML